MGRSFNNEQCFTEDDLTEWCHSGGERAFERAARHRETCARCAHIWNKYWAEQKEITVLVVKEAEEYFEPE